MRLFLRGYWRSGAANRVRIPLDPKGLDHAQITHDVRMEAQRAPDYTAIAPHGPVPAPDDDGGIPIERPAILCATFLEGIVQI